MFGTSIICFVNVRWPFIPHRPIVNTVNNVCQGNEKHTKKAQYARNSHHCHPAVVVVVAVAVVVELTAAVLAATVAALTMPVLV